MSVSIWSSAPVRTKTSCSESTSAGLRAGSPSRPSSSRSAVPARANAERDERGRLAFAEVVADGLAGDLRVAERAEHVVAELERVSEGKADRRQRGPEPVEGATERGAEVQRPFDRVLPRLVDGDAIRELGLGARGRGAREIERLADAQLDP